MRFLTSRENKANFKPAPYVVNPPVHNSNGVFQYLYVVYYENSMYELLFKPKTNAEREIW